MIDTPSDRCLIVEKKVVPRRVREYQARERSFKRLNGTKTVGGEPHSSLGPFLIGAKGLQNLRVPSTNLTLRTRPLLHRVIRTHPFTFTFRFVPPQRPLVRRWYPSIHPHAESRYCNHVSAADVNVSWWTSFIHQMTYRFCTVSTIYQRRL